MKSRVLIAEMAFFTSFINVITQRRSNVSDLRGAQHKMTSAGIL